LLVSAAEPVKDVLILVATVEHSGTHFLLKLLGHDDQDEGGTRRRVRPLAERHRGPTDILFAHLYDKDMDMILAAAAELPTVTSARAADAIARSWARRGRDLDELDRQLHNREQLLELRPNVLQLGRRL
jgi:hypothetical protein